MKLLTYPDKVLFVLLAVCWARGTLPQFKFCFKEPFLPKKPIQNALYFSTQMYKNHYSFFA